MGKPRIAPVRWTPPPAPPRAKRKSGPEPVAPPRLVPLPGHGPEDVVVDAEGRLLTGLYDGRIVRVDPATGGTETVATASGRPLGLEALPDGRLLVCAGHAGLLRVDPATGAVEPLVTQIDGAPLTFCSNAVAAPDGTVYFTESTRRYGFDHWRADIYEHTATGRLFRLDQDGTVTTLLDGLAFANGVALAADGTYLVVAQTGAYELTRYHLTGPRAGTAEPWAANLPGSPDNISRGPSGLVWAALPSPRDPRLDWLLPRAPWLRKAAYRVPDALVKPLRTCWVVGLDTDGRIVRDLQVPGDRWAFATGVAEHDGRLYVASIAESSIAVLDL
jgi:sugar lactone lactonase YvrE